MSADNWTACPRCNKQWREDIAQMQFDLDQSYGVVPLDVFDQARADLSAKQATKPNATLREDYEFYGANEGVLHIDYAASCSLCGFSHAYKAEETMDV